MKQMLDLFLQSSKGLNHLHKHKLVHRDIKLQNILVQGPSDCPVVKIADFGISRIIERELTNMTALGTNAYMAPELFSKDKPSAGQGVDTFSLAITFWTILDPKDGSTGTPRKGEHFSLAVYNVFHSHSGG
jgi:serine/threonine protein kinase